MPGFLIMFFGKKAGQRADKKLVKRSARYRRRRNQVVARKAHLDKVKGRRRPRPK